MKLVTLAAIGALALLATPAPALARGHADAEVVRLVDFYASLHNVPPRIAHGVVRIESGYRCGARNRSGAAGLGQLMPRTARALGVRNPLDCRDNLNGTMRYLRQALDRGGAGCAGVSLYNRGIHARPACTSYGRRVMSAGGGR